MKKLLMIFFFLISNIIRQKLLKRSWFLAFGEKVLKNIALNFHLDFINEI
jgi:hypothetical protein